MYGMKVRNDRLEIKRIKDMRRPVCIVRALVVVSDTLDSYGVVTSRERGEVKSATQSLP